MKKKIAVICQKDPLWALYAWNKVFKESEINDFDFVGFWNCEEKFVNIKPKDTLKWYFNTFGKLNFLKLGLFAVSYKISLFLIHFSKAIAAHLNPFAKQIK